MDETSERFLRSWDAAWKKIAEMKLRTVGRVGYGTHVAVAGLGWRRVFWRFWWFDRKQERALLERWAEMMNVQPMAGETTDQLRERMNETMRGRP